MKANLEKDPILKTIGDQLGTKNQGKGSCHPARAVLRAALQRFLGTRNFPLVGDSEGFVYVNPKQTASQPSREGQVVRRDER